MFGAGKAGEVLGHQAVRIQALRGTGFDSIEFGEYIALLGALPLELVRGGDHVHRNRQAH